MKIAILTQFTKNSEVKALQDALTILGYDSKIINIRDLVFEIGSKTEENGLFFEGDNLLNYDLVITRFVVNAFRRIKFIIKYLRSHNVKVYDNNLEKNGYYIDKITDSIIFINNNILYPSTINVMDEDDFKESSESITDNNFPIIVKNAYGTTAQSVFELEDMEDVEDFVDKVKAEDKKIRTYIIQEHIAFKENISVLVIGKKIIGAIENIDSSANWKKYIKRFINAKKYPLSNEISDIVLKGINKINVINGVADILITQEEKIYLIDINRTPYLKPFEKYIDKNILDLFIQECINSAY